MRHSAGTWSGKTSEVPSFPLDPLRETASHFKGVNRDVISPNGTFGKPHPTLDAQNGMSFPMVIQDQKHVR